MYSRLRHTLSGKQLKIEPLQVIEILCARMVELVDTRDLKSRGPGRVRAGSSPAPGTNIHLPELCGIARRILFRCLSSCYAAFISKDVVLVCFLFSVFIKALTKTQGAGPADQELG